MITTFCVPNPCILPSEPSFELLRNDGRVSYFKVVLEINQYSVMLVTFFI